MSTSAHPALRFSALVGGFLIALGGGGFFLLESAWGSATIPILGWGVAWSWVLAVCGYITLRRGLGATSQRQMMNNVLGGLLLRLAIIVVAHALAFKFAGQEWVQRALFTTLGLYMMALGLEVFALNRALKRGELGARPRGQVSGTPVARP